jgi:hypothetical protein
MTKKQQRYKENQYYIRYHVDDWECQKCHKPAKQQGHRISQSKINLKKYGYKIIHHNFNLASCCSLACNDFFNIGNSKIKIEKLLSLIKKRGYETLTTEFINNILEVGIK